MSEWKPIDSAPKDGSKFWGQSDGGDAIVMFWHEGFGEFVTGFRRMELVSGMTFAKTGLGYKDHSPEIEKPLAWMPIPAASLQSDKTGR